MWGGAPRTMTNAQARLPGVQTHSAGKGNMSSVRRTRSAHPLGGYCRDNESSNAQTKVAARTSLSPLTIWFIV